MKITKRKIELHARRSSFTLELPFKRVVCSRCDGTGKHVNRAIDGNGINPEEFEEDPDFAEGYFSGRYDVQCEVCKGERVVWEIAYEKLSKRERVLWNFHVEEERKYEAERASELRYGY